VAVGQAWIPLGAEKKLEAGKVLENAAESPPPNARCVWQRFSSFLYEQFLITEFYFVLGNPREHSILKCFCSFTFFNILEKRTLRLI